MPDHGLRREDEIIGRFKLHLGVVGVGRFADGRDLAVRAACAEGEGRQLEAELQLLTVEAATPGSAANLPGRGKRPLHDLGPRRKNHAMSPIKGDRRNAAGITSARGLNGGLSTQDDAARRRARAAANAPATPRANRVRLVISGTVWPASENVALNVGAGLPH